MNGWFAGSSLFAPAKPCGQKAEGKPMRAVFAVSAVFGVCLALVALYQAIYFGWLTATPLTEGQMQRRAQYDCYAWFAIFVVASLSAIRNRTRCRQ